MTVSNTNSTAVYTGNDSAVDFDFTFPLTEESDLVVKLFTIATEVETTLLASQYTVVFTRVGGKITGGTVTYPKGVSPTPISTTHKIILERNIPYTQPLEVSNQGGFSPKNVEGALDRLTMQVQQLRNLLDNVFVLSPGSSVAELGQLYTALDGAVTSAEAAQAAAVVAQVAAEAAQVAAEAAETSVIETLTSLGAVASLESLGPSLAQGDLLYAQATDQLVRLPVAADGKILTLVSGLPAWADAADTGATRLVEEIVLSNDAAANFTNFDSDLFSSYFFVLQNVIPSVDATAFYLQTSANGGSSYDATSGHYQYAGTANLLSSPFTASFGSSTAIGLSVMSGIGSAANEDGVSGTVRLYAPHLAKRTQITWETISMDLSGALYTQQGGGFRAASAAVNAVRFIFNTGNLESGTISMYGLVKGA